jgi:hypothetical protein
MLQMAASHVVICWRRRQDRRHWKHVDRMLVSLLQGLLPVQISSLVKTLKTHSRKLVCYSTRSAIAPECWLWFSNVFGEMGTDAESPIYRDESYHPPGLRLVISKVCLALACCSILLQRLQLEAGDIWGHLGISDTVSILQCKGRFDSNP